MKILFAGDYCPQTRIADRIENGDYDIVTNNIRKYIQDADYSIINFECCITNGDEKPIPKCGPNLHCSERGLAVIKEIGFDCITLANNHFLDYGEKGVYNTLESSKKYSLETVGGGCDLSQASSILYKIIKDKIVAIINCCEHEFSIATDTRPGSNPLNSINQYYQIKEAKGKSNYVIVIVHGGNEHYQLPSPRMQDLYRFFIDIGADAVVNHHQHCLSGYELYKNKPILYGIGNFCFDNPDKRNERWNYGLISVIDFDGKDVKLEIIPIEQCSDLPVVQLLNQEDKEIILNKIKELNTIIHNRIELVNNYNDFIKLEAVNLRSVFSPYNNRVLNALCNRRLIPSFIGKTKRRLIKAYIQCESHLPKVLKYLEE